jgi:hypothetical protein
MADFVSFNWAIKIPPSENKAIVRFLRKTPEGVRERIKHTLT